jgi:poly-gamma-glutamate synthesis protein (capsule biosynthesis protein)
MPTIALLGDVMLGRGVNDELQHVEPAAVWGSVLPVLRAADAVVVNLECAITRQRARWRRAPKVFHFRADPRAIEVLAAGNVRCVTLANNHSLDFEVAGLLETLDLLDAAGIARVGAGRNLAEARAPVVLEIGGVRVGFMGATDNEPLFQADRDRPGTGFVDIERSPDAVDAVAEPIAAARAAGAAVVVLALHWGPNMVTEPPDVFREFAGAVLDRGADVLYGHSAHVFQGVERLDGNLVLYDTGDFIDDYAVDAELRNDWSFVFLVDVTTGGRLERLRMLPVRLDYAQVNLAMGEECRAICDLMRRRSRAFGTSLSETADGLELVLDE